MLRVSVITQNKDTALMVAARFGRTEVVSLLLKAGANTNLHDEVKRYHSYYGYINDIVRGT